MPGVAGISAVLSEEATEDEDLDVSVVDSGCREELAVSCRHLLLQLSANT